VFFTLRDFRKAAARIPILAGLVWLGAGCKADLPKQVALDAGVDRPCSVYADLLVAFNPPGSEGGSELGAKALGPPDGDSVPIATNAVLTLAFLGLGGIVDETGDDLQVHGSFGAGAEIAVYVGFGEGQREFSGSLTSASSTIDIATASAGTVSYVEMVGIAGSGTVDALESLKTLCPVAPTP
jgi:hypothetical protein